MRSSESLRHPARVRGFSLLELVFGFAIVSIFLAMTAVSLKDSVNREGPKALAYTLASDIKAARSEAKRSGRLVGFCLPSDNKTNSFAQNAIVRKGEQRGAVHRVLGYGREYSGFIFTGSWPGSKLENFDLPGDWAGSTAGELSLYFRPDGTAFSPDIPAVEGNYAFVVGSRFTWSGGGANGLLSGIENPHTVWVSRSGNVAVEENRVPGKALALGSDLPTVASLGYLKADKTPSSPKIQDIKFLPDKVDGLNTVGMGQNYVNVHPDQKESERLEYGIATMRIRAKDADGGPLYYQLDAVASKGDAGKFSVSQQSGAMDYIYDEASRQYFWQSVVSWRPPPGAEENIQYELQITVRDEQGNSDKTVSGAGLLPVVSTLPPVRMVMSAADGTLLLANVEGASTIALTKPGEAERDPFFSPDGSRIYSFRDLPGGGQEFRVRNADGSQSFRILRTFSADVTRTLKYDPTYQYVAYFDPGSTTAKYYKYQEEMGIKVYQLVDRYAPHYGERLEILHLLADEPPVTVTTTLENAEPFYWDAQKKHTLVFSQSDPKEPSKGKLVKSPFVHEPGFVVEKRSVLLDGYPPRLREQTPPGTLAADSRVYNPNSENWFLDLSSGGLSLGNTAGGSSRLTTAPIVGKPSWSSDGTQVAYVERMGASQRVVTKRVLAPDMSTVSQQTLYQTSGSGLSNAQLSPHGDWVFFQQSGVIFRAVNASGSAKINVSAKTGKVISSYAISP